jgi:hypothetical protein
MEEAIETKESVVTESAMEETMLGESLLRTVTRLLRINQLTTGTV